MDDTIPLPTQDVASLAYVYNKQALITITYGMFAVYSPHDTTISTSAYRKMYCIHYSCEQIAPNSRSYNMPSGQSLVSTLETCPCPTVRDGVECHRRRQHQQ